MGISSRCQSSRTPQEVEDREHDQDNHDDADDPASSDSSKSSKHVYPSPFARPVSILASSEYPFWDG
jgi:hypothetical protein